MWFAPTAGHGVLGQRPTPGVAVINCTTLDR
jgi:hypothetical protein